MAGTLAEEVIQASTDFDRRERAPMRLTEARITLGVVKAREGDLEGAVDLGARAGRRPQVPALPLDGQPGSRQSPQRTLLR